MSLIANKKTDNITAAERVWQWTHETPSLLFKLHPKLTGKREKKAGYKQLKASFSIMPFTRSMPGTLDKLINRGTSKTGLSREMPWQVTTYKIQLQNFTFFLTYSKTDIIFRMDRYWLNSWNYYIAETASDTVSM